MYVYTLLYVYIFVGFCIARQLQYRGFITKLPLHKRIVFALVWPIGLLLAVLFVWLKGMKEV